MIDFINFVLQLPLSHQITLYMLFSIACFLIRQTILWFFGISTIIASLNTISKYNEHLHNDLLTIINFQKQNKIPFTEEQKKLLTIEEVENCCIFKEI